MHGTVRDLTAHQIRSKCSGGGGTTLCGADLDFWLYLTMQTPLCQHCRVLLGLRVSSDFGDHYAHSTVNRPDELIPL